MARSRLMLGVVGLAVLTGVGWYVVRLQSEVARLQKAAPASPRVPAPAAENGRSLAPEQREAMLAKLGGAGSSSVYPVWFATATGNPEAVAFQRTLQAVFEEAGWQVRGNAPVRFQMKAGVYVFAADEEPPEYVSVAQEALDAAGISITAGRGYRDFYREKKAENPSWIGFDMAADQTYVIAIGRKPDAPAS